MAPQLLAGAAALPGAAVAASSTEVNLDGDPEPERLVVRDIVTGDPPYQLTQQTAAIEDTCAGQPAAFELLREPEDHVDTLRALQAQDIGERPEILVLASSGAAGRAGAAKLARYEDCASARTLFSYDTATANRRLRRYGVAFFRVSLRNLTRRYAGREIRLTEGLATRSDALCCPSRRRVTLLGYNAGRDRYVAYSRRVVRVRRSKR
jgi:hypothetical protein